MQNNYICSIINSQWSKINTDIGEFSLAISCILYQQSALNIYKIDSKIFVITNGKISINKKTYSNSKLIECINFMQSLYLEINNKNFNIFKFDDSQNYNMFAEWYRKKEEDLILAIEK